MIEEESSLQRVSLPRMIQNGEHCESTMMHLRVPVLQFVNRQPTPQLSLGSLERKIPNGKTSLAFLISHAGGGAAAAARDLIRSDTEERNKGGEKKYVRLLLGWGGGDGMQAYARGTINQHGQRRGPHISSTPGLQSKHFLLCHVINITWEDKNSPFFLSFSFILLFNVEKKIYFFFFFYNSI